MSLCLFTGGGFPCDHYPLCHWSVMVTPYQMGPIQTCSPGTLFHATWTHSIKNVHLRPSLTSIGKQSVGLHMKCLLVKNGLQILSLGNELNQFVNYQIYIWQPKILNIVSSWRKHYIVVTIRNWLPVLENTW